MKVHAGPAEGATAEPPCQLLTFGLAPSLTCVWLQHQLSPTSMVQVPTAPGPCTECSPPHPLNGTATPHRPLLPAPHPGASLLLQPDVPDHGHPPQPPSDYGAIRGSTGHSLKLSAQVMHLLVHKTHPHVSPGRPRGRPTGAGTCPPSPDLQTAALWEGARPVPRDRVQGPAKVCAGALPPWSSFPGAWGGAKTRALRGRSHVQSHDAQAEALTTVSGSPVTRPGPQGGPGGGDHPEQGVGSETLLAFPWGADRMFAQTHSMTAVLAQVATGLLGSGPRGTRPWQGGLGPAGDCRWRHRTAGPAEGGGGHKCFCDSEMGRGRERDPTARPPLPRTSVLTRDMTVPPVKVCGPRDPV